jgi:hypothetical protein
MLGIRVGSQLQKNPNTLEERAGVESGPQVCIVQDKAGLRRAALVKALQAIRIQQQHNALLYSNRTKSTAYFMALAFCAQSI